MSTVQAAAWPEGVIGRYLTVGGATVDLVEYMEASGTAARCSACPAQRGFDWDRPTGRHSDGSYREIEDREQANADARAWAQAHAEKCRAMPQPGGGSR